jgi:chromosome segregation ATPase
MRSVTTYRVWLVFGMIAVLVVLPARAADKPDKYQAQTRRLQQQLRAAEEEKGQLAQQKADAESQLKDAQRKAVDAQRRADAVTGMNSRLSKELETIKAEKEALATASKAEQAALAAKLAETERKLVEQRLAYGAEKQQIEAVLAKYTAALTGCRERNDRMYKLGNELLEKYEHKSCFTSVLQAEPFTGLKRAQIEKMMEEDREKLDKDQLLPAQGAEAAAPAH